ncbi:MAG: type II secretion system protein [Candidatus Riflebacteria bacterium]|nr:type II secretion system protein [Candidatus Riflebacteria bacterium]
MASRRRQKGASASAPGARLGFSFVELLTVVAMMAILACAAVPLASSLYRRNRENALRETLITLRMAITNYPKNGYDDDGDNRVDEDPRGDSNHDGAPGLRGVADGLGGTDADGAGEPMTLLDGRLSSRFDQRFRADDDEDGLIDEEAFPPDLNDLVGKMGFLRNRIPVDPTTAEASWRVVLSRVNNDADWGSSALEDGVPQTIVLGPPDATGQHPAVITKVLKPTYPKPVPDVSTLNKADFSPLVDEDPRDGLDDDGDGRTDEDPPEVVGVRSWNVSEASDGTKYCDW